MSSPLPTQMGKGKRVRRALHRGTSQGDFVCSTLFHVRDGFFFSRNQSNADQVGGVDERDEGRKARGEEACLFASTSQAQGKDRVREGDLYLGAALGT